LRLILSGALDGLLAAGVFALMASGLTLIFGVMRVINLAQAAFVILGAYLSYQLQAWLQLDPFIGLLITMPLLFVVGVLLEVLVLSRLERDRELMSLLVTFAIAVIVEGLLNSLFGSSFITLGASYVNETFDVGGFPLERMQVYTFALSIAVLAALYGLLYRTTFGRSLRAAMENELGAELIGIDRARVSAITFGIGTALAGVGGMALASTSSVNPNSMYALMPTLLAIVILGGLGSLSGALIAAAVILVAEGITSVTWSATWAVVLSYSLMAVVLLVRPRGIFGRSEARAQ
jgi:branched-chain amino acid transport system permease protein